jgi:hypothetical protein
MSKTCGLVGGIHSLGQHCFDEEYQSHMSLIQGGSRFIYKMAQSAHHAGFSEYFISVS